MKNSNSFETQTARSSFSVDTVKGAICTIVPILKSLIRLFERQLWWMEPLRRNKKKVTPLLLLSICQELDWTPDF